MELWEWTGREVGLLDCQFFPMHFVFMSVKNTITGTDNDSAPAKLRGDDVDHKSFNAAVRTHELVSLLLA
jgi:hypothetical protein